MHILITSLDHYLDLRGGAPRLAYDEARYLAAAGHRVTALAVGDDGAGEVQEDGNVTWLRYKPRPFSAADPRRMSAHDRAARDLLRRHVDTRVDVVHGHAPFGYLAACDLFESHAKTVYSVHSPASMEMEINWPRRTLADKVRRGFGLPLMRRIERECLERSSAVAAHSDFSKQQVTRIHGPRLGGKIQVIPGWVDLERFRIIQDRDSAKKSLGWPLDVPVLFTLRRLVPRMGLDRLIRAVQMVRDWGHSMRLVIGGAGPLRDELLQLATSLGLDDWIQFAGRVPDSKLAAMYGACDAFVLPTAALECFGLIALEALACGRPVLATPVAAIPEVLSNFERQWLARSADETAIADLICAFLSGHLPQHSPAQLRSRAQALYCNQDRLRQLAQLLVPEPKTTGLAAGGLGKEQAGSGNTALVRPPRPRILAVADWYVPAYKAGGPIRSVSNMVASLGENEFEFYILTRDRDFTDPVPYPHVPIDSWTPVGHAQVLYSAEYSLRNLRRRIAEVDPDIIYFNSLFSTITIKILSLRRLGLLPRAGVVVAPRGSFSPSALGLKKTKKKLFIALASFIGLYRDVLWHATTEREKTDMERVFSKSSLGKGGRIEVASPILVPLDVREDLPHCRIGIPDKQPGHVSFLFISRVSRTKNLAEAIHRLSGIKGNVAFDIYGPIDDRGYWEECQASIAASPSNVTVRYLGPLPHGESLHAFCQHHFLLLPTLGESFGHVISESLSAGCPVVISDQTPWRDLDSKRIGWDLPLNERVRWQQVLQQCVDMDGETYRDMSRRATEFLRDKLRSSKSRNEFLNLFKCAAARASEAEMLRSQS